MRASLLCGRVVGVALAGALLMLSAACAQFEPGRSDPPREEEAVDATVLVDIWRVSGAEDEGADTWLKFGAGEFVLWHECSVVFGAYRTSGSLLLATPDWAQGWPECLLPSGPPQVPWLESVRGFDVAGEQVRLLDGAGATVATLTADGSVPPETPGVDSSVRDRPELTEELAAALAAPPPLPPEAAPADVIGRWLPAQAPEGSEAFVEFSSGGTWTGSDGCNGQGGRWASGHAGALVATAGPSTLIYCEGAPVGAWLSTATRAGIVDEQLVLFDVTGAELGRLTRG